MVDHLDVPSEPGRPADHGGHSYPLGVFRRAHALLCLAAVCLAAAGPAAAQATASPDPVPVVGIHFQDLVPGSSEDVTMAVAAPRLPAPDAVTATSDSDCLAVGEPTNIRFEVWRVPAKLTRLEPCRADVTITATYGAESWRGRVLVGVYPLMNVAPLGLDSGLEYAMASGIEAPEDGGSGRERRFDELTITNGSERAVRLVSLSWNPARDELLGAAFLRTDDGGTRLREPYSSHVRMTVRPGGRLTLGFEATADGLLIDSPTAVTLGLLPLVAIGDETYYLDTGLATSFSWPEAP